MIGPANMDFDVLSNCLEAVDHDHLEFAVVRGLPPEPDATAKQALVFVKPELLYPDLDRMAILRFVHEALDKQGLAVHGVAVLAPRRLEKVVAAHYGVINRVSRLGTEALTSVASNELESNFGEQISAGVPVLGGHQAIARLGVSVDELTKSMAGIPPVKLAPGTYATPVVVRDERLVVLNGFHPEQLLHYTAEDARVVAFEVSWTGLPWEQFRSRVIGATNPTAAHEDSIRGHILRNSAEWGLREVSISRNGVHGSAGPLEAMVELSRFFAAAPADTAFGRLVSASGVPAVSRWLGYDQIPADEMQRAFDATEDTEPEPAVEALGQP